MEEGCLVFIVKLMKNNNNVEWNRLPLSMGIKKDKTLKLETTALSNYIVISI